MPDWDQIVHDFESRIEKLEGELAIKVENEAKVYRINLVGAGVAFFLGFIIGLSF